MLVVMRKGATADEIRGVAEAIEAYTAAGREDRAATERKEQQVLEAYLPAGLSELEVDALIEEAVAAIGAAGPGDLGKVMGIGAEWLALWESEALAGGTRIYNPDADQHALISTVCEQLHLSGPAVSL